MFLNITICSLHFLVLYQWNVNAFLSDLLNSHIYFENHLVVQIINNSFFFLADSILMYRYVTMPFLLFIDQYLGILLSGNIIK